MEITFAMVLGHWLDLPEHGVHNAWWDTNAKLIVEQHILVAVPFIWLCDLAD